MKLVDIFKTRTRNPMRPRSSDLIKALFTDFRDYGAKGDSLIIGKAHLAGRKVYVVAQQKPKMEQLRSAKDVGKLNWGMLTASEHSQILQFLDYIKRTGPHEDAVLFSIVDTFGADISMYSAQRLQAFFIAHLIRAYLNVPIRTISLVLGEGGSGGALAVQVADRRGAMEDASYATAPPESLAAIIFRDPSRLEDALTVSKCTPKDLRHFGAIDAVVPMTRQLTDVSGMADNIRVFLEKSMRELMRRKLSRLMDARLTNADELGKIQTGAFYELKRYIERPLMHLRKPPQDIKVVNNYRGGIQVDDDYGEGSKVASDQPHIRCGEETTKSGKKGGCGALIPLEDYLANHQICPHCEKSNVLDAAGWINAIADPGRFHELFRNLTVYDLLPEEDIHRYYADFLKKQKGASSFTESLVTAHARVHGYPAVLAVSDFSFAGGSMGVVFGEKFRLATEYALRRKWPLISVCCSGGARLYEGIVALMQMTKTVASVERLKRAGIPFISVLADPSTGGAIASFAALGDVCLAEPGALVIFTGPRVMAARGFEVDEELVRSDSLREISRTTLDKPDYFGEIRGIQEIVPRYRLRQAIAKYLELFARYRTGSFTKKDRPYFRRVQSSVAPKEFEDELE